MKCINAFFLAAVTLQGCTWCTDCCSSSDVDDCIIIEQFTPLEELVEHVLVATPIIESELIRYCKQLLLLSEDEGVGGLSLIVEDLIVRTRLRSRRIRTLLPEPIDRFEHRKEAFRKQFRRIGSLIYRRCVYVVSA